MNTLITVEPDAEELSDVSFYQKPMNWAEYKTKARAVILRIGQNVWKDPEFEYNYSECVKYGIAKGGYWFYDGRASPRQQFDTIMLAIAGKSFELEIYIDWEINYNGAHEGLNNVVALMQLLDSAGIKCKAIGMYTGYYFFVENSSPIGNASQYAYLKNKPLWLAWYSSATIVKIPPPWTDYTLWQYGTPTIDMGQPTLEIDMNKSRLGKGEFSAYYLGGIQPPPIGEVMKLGTLKNNIVLNYRSGVGTTYPVQGQIRGATSTYAGDKVVGVIDPATNWFTVDHFIISGVKTIPPTQVYCSAYNSPTDGYYSSIVDYVPPVEPPPVITGQDVTVTIKLEGQQPLTLTGTTTPL